MSVPRIWAGLFGAYIRAPEIGNSHIPPFGVPYVHLTSPVYHESQRDSGNTPKSEVDWICSGRWLPSNILTLFLAHSRARNLGGLIVAKALCTASIWGLFPGSYQDRQPSVGYSQEACAGCAYELSQHQGPRGHIIDGHRILHSGHTMAAIVKSL